MPQSKPMPWLKFFIYTNMFMMIIMISIYSKPIVNKIPATPYNKTLYSYMKW